MNIVMESVHMVFDDKRILGIVDEGNNDALLLGPNIGEGGLNTISHNNSFSF